MSKRVAASAEERDELKATEILEKLGGVPPNNFWDDANRAYEELLKNSDSANLLLAERIQAAMATPQRRARIKDENEVASNLKLVTKDILAFRSRLAEIKAKHADRHGAATTSEDLILVMDINEMYRVAMCLYNDNVMPVVAHTLELIGEDTDEAEAALQQQAKAADQRENIVTRRADEALDPNVITDVVPREPTIKNDPEASGT